MDDLLVGVKLESFAVGRDLIAGHFFPTWMGIWVVIGVHGEVGAGVVGVPFGFAVVPVVLIGAGLVGLGGFGMGIGCLAMGIGGGLVRVDVGGIAGRVLGFVGGLVGPSAGGLGACPWCSRRGCHLLKRAGGVKGQALKIEEVTHGEKNNKDGEAITKRNRMQGPVESGKLPRVG